MTQGRKNDLGQGKSDLGHFGPADRFPDYDLVLTQDRKKVTLSGQGQDQIDPGQDENDPGQEKSDLTQTLS